MKDSDLQEYLENQVKNFIYHINESSLDFMHIYYSNFSEMFDTIKENFTLLLPRFENEINKLHKNYTIQFHKSETFDFKIYIEYKQSNCLSSEYNNLNNLLY